MAYPSYLVHFNQNHSAKNGQFISGDGDGDGISNDHKNQKKTSSKKNNSYGMKVAKAANKFNSTGKKIVNRQKEIWNKKSTFEKSIYILGNAAVIAGIIGIGVEMVMDNKNASVQTIRNTGSGKIYVDDIKRASAATVVGGDW